ncbi:MAG: hypothetical protein WEE67_08170 [Chloroflexota bacterium]
MKRITAVLLALLVLLAVPGSASAAPTDISKPSQVNAAVSNGHAWITNIVCNGQGCFNHYVRVCDYGFNSSSTIAARIIDALNQWNAIDGELLYEWMGSWSDATCNSEMANSPLPTVMITNAQLSGSPVGLLGQTDNNWINAQGKIYNCRVDIDRAGATWNGQWNMQGVTGSWYTGSGSPGPTQLDFEGTVAHEMGHCLSWDNHLDSPNGALMYNCWSPTCASPP